MTDEQEMDGELQEFLEKHVKELSVRFDSVQVVATQHDPSTDQTHNFYAGRGNWHARINSTRTLVLRADAIEKAEAVANMESEDDE